MKRSVVSGFGISVLAVAVALAGCGGGGGGGTGGSGGRGGSGGTGGRGGSGGAGGNTTGGSTGGSTTGGTGGSTTGGTGGSTTGGSGGTGGSTGGTGGSPDGGTTPDFGSDTPITVNLKVAWWGSTDRHERTVKVIDLFKRKYPHINVTFEYDASTPYWVKMNAHAAANTLPDVMQQDHKYIEEWSTKGRIIDLDPLVADGSLKLTDVPKPLVDGGRVGGKLVALNLGSNTQTFALDVDAFMKAGVTIPADNWTWTDFENVVKELHMKSMPAVWGQGVGVTGDSIWKNIYLSEGSWVFNAMGTALGYSDDAPWVDFLKMVQRLQMLGAIPTRMQQKTDYNTTNVELYPMVKQLAAMEHLSGSNQLVALWSAAEKPLMAGGMNRTRNFKLLPVPRRPGKGPSVFIKPSQYLSITSTSQYKKEAAWFLDFFTNDIEANKILAGERGVPINTKVLAELKKTLGKSQVETFNIIEKLGANDVRPLPPPDPPAYGDLVKYIYDPKVNDAVLLTGTATPEQATAQFRTEANSLLAGNPITDGGTGDTPDAGAADGPDDAASDAGTAQALMVVGAVQQASDMEIQARLATKLTVEVQPEAMVTAASASGRRLVVITATASLAGTGTKFADVTVPVMVMEPNLLAPMGMTADGATNRGTTSGGNQVTISTAAAAAPLTAGLTGNVTVYIAPYRIVWGIPGTGAIVGATVVGTPTQATIFAYPSGSMMVGRTAPGKRLSFFIHNNIAANVAPDGFKLLDAAVDWLIAP